MASCLLFTSSSRSLLQGCTFLACSAKRGELSQNGRARWRSKVHEQCWWFAEEEENSSMERICPDEGFCVLPGDGEGQQQVFEELGLVPSAVSDSTGWHERLGVQYMYDQRCNEECFKFFDIAAILVARDGKPHTINLCRNCHNLRVAERDDTKGTNAV